MHQTPPGKQPKKPLIRTWIWGLPLSLIALSALAWFWPARPVDLRKIDPGQFALREASAWRAYYEERYLSLIWQVFQFAHSGYGFSLRESARLSWHAARAAASFRHSNKPEDLAAARRHINKYYALVSQYALHPFDSAEVAKLELQWWRQRREKLPPEAWARTIAQQCHLIYGLPMEAFLPSVRLRVGAMAYRDSLRHSVMTEKNWQTIRSTLSNSARQFREVVTQ